MRDEELVRRAQQGEQAALHDLRQRTARVVTLRVKQLLAGRPRLPGLKVEEAVNEIYLKLFEGVPPEIFGYVAEKGALDGYISVLSTSRFIDYIRRVQVMGGRTVPIDGAPEPTDRAATPEQIAIQQQLVRRTRAYVLEHLPERGQIVFRMHFDDHRSPEEIANALGVTRQVVFNWVHRCRVLARELADRDGRNDK